MQPQLPPANPVVRVGNLMDRWFCSGFFVGDDTIVTAGHCVTGDRYYGANAISGESARRLNRRAWTTSTSPPSTASFAFTTTSAVKS